MEPLRPHCLCGRPAARCITNCRGKVYKPAFVRMNTLAADNKSAVKRKVTVSSV